MRKISITPGCDPVTFEPHVTLRIKDKHAKLEFKVSIVAGQSKYSAEEQRKIDACNSMLIKNGQDEMSEEETEYFNNPMPVKQPTPEELQTLSGFKVEKTITYCEENSVSKKSNTTSE